jgi:hypothetical protein
MAQLIAAAVCYGAVSNRLYTDKRAKLLKSRALARLLVSAKEYHSTYLALAFLG